MITPIITITRNDNTARIYRHPNPTTPRNQGNLATLIVNKDAAPNHGLQPLETSHMPGYEIPSFALTLVTLDDVDRPHRNIENKYGTYFLTGNIRHPNEIKIAEAITDALRNKMPFYLVRFDEDGQLRIADAIHYADGIMFMDPQRVRRNAPAWCDTPESLNNYAWAVLDNEYELLRQYYAGEIYTFTVNDKTGIEEGRNEGEYIAYETIHDFIEDVVEPYLDHNAEPGAESVTIITASGGQVEGIPNAFLNEYKGETQVFVGNTLASTYADLLSETQAINMMLEDYGITN